MPAAFKADPSVDMKTPPLDQINKMPAKIYFTYAAELLRLNPPHVTDWSTTARLKRIGIEAGKNFDWDKLGADIQEALTTAAADGPKTMYAKLPTLAKMVNGMADEYRYGGCVREFLFKACDRSYGWPRSQPA